MPGGHAAKQIGVTFSADEMDLYAGLELYRKRTGASISKAVKTALRASLLNDPEAIETLRLMKSFSGAATADARRPVIVAGRKVHA